MMTVLISSCSLISPIKNDITQYQLTCTPNPAISHTHSHKTIIINKPTATPINNSAAMAYTIKPFQIAYFAKNRWVASPSEMLEPMISDVLRKTHYFYAVESASSLSHYDFVLNTEILQFQQVFYGCRSVFRIKLYAELQNARTRKIVGSRTFMVERMAPYYSPLGGVMAANQATALLLEELSSWTLGTLRY